MIPIAAPRRSQITLRHVWEILKFLVENLAKAVPALKGMQGDRRRAEIGTALFLFYTQANQSLVIGREVTRSLRVYVERMERHIATGSDPYALTAGHWVENNLRLQANLLGDIQRSFLELESYLALVVDNDSYNSLHQLLGVKRSAVNTLRQFMVTGTMPLDSAFGLELLTAPTQDYQLSADLAVRYHNAIERIPTNVPWEADILIGIKRYLELRQPEDVLEEIAEKLEVVRAAIVENFELKDILLRVADARLSSAREPMIFT